MKPMTYSKLIGLMEEVINEENEYRAEADGGYVYEALAKDMAKAARLVYDASLHGSRMAEASA